MTKLWTVRVTVETEAYAEAPQPAPLTPAATLNASVLAELLRQARAGRAA